MRIHAQLKAGDFPNCRKIAEEIEVSSKTIQRDIDFMRDRLGLPIEYDALRFGFHYTEEVASFPSIEVSEGEVAALFVAQKALAQYRGTPFERPLRSAFRKIADSLKERVSFSWSDIEDTISFHSAGASVADLELFEKVSQARPAFGRIGIRISKTEQQRLRAAPRPAVPHRLPGESVVPLRGRSGAKGSAHFRAAAHAQCSPNEYKDSDDRRIFPSAKFLSGSFGVFEGGKKHRIKLQFDAFAARLVSERTWHESQRFRAAKDGSAILELELGGLEEIERWILSWGSHALVLEPAILRERIHAEANRTAEIYERKSAPKSSR